MITALTIIGAVIVGGIAVELVLNLVHALLSSFDD
jgi:hypothetical protein